MEPLCTPLPVRFHGADVTKEYKGVPGLWRLYKELKKLYHPDVIIDLHYVLRSRVLSIFFKSNGTPVYHINKGREGKKALSRPENKVRRQLPHTTERYAEVFRQAGLQLDFDPKDQPKINFISEADLTSLLPENLDTPIIGLAPFAQHKGKMWPLSKSAKLLERLQALGYHCILFGGPQERKELDKLASGTMSRNAAGNFTLGVELTLMKELDVMIAMDSSNMHMATLAGIPVVSIWGATHSAAGFGPLGENEDLKAEIAIDKLECRPCSVYGNKPCLRGDYACLNWLEVADVLQKVELALKHS
ncbi:MAG TPA: glycosyl transferase [Cryomorphaceae bacterium]|nr:glycosyl transferase [Cryomorphaceae bacterium]